MPRTQDRQWQDRHVRVAIVIGAIAIAVRFIAIDQPFVDEWSWRQSDVAAIARNFFTGGFHFTRPQIDWAGDQSGYVGTEFPILPFVAALSYKIFGVHEWIGRAQAVVLFAASLPFFFLLLRGIFGARAATYALFFYSFAPLCVMTSRCFMPDMPALSLSIIGVFFFKRWIATARSTSYFASALCILLAILIKAPSALIAAPLAVLAVAAVYDLRILQLILFGALAVIPAAIWYAHAWHIAQNFYPHHFFGAGGFQVKEFSWYFTIVRRLFLSSLTPVLFVVATVGAITARSTIKARALYAWLGAAILFVIIAGYGNRHPWYQLPLVPLAAAFAGDFCARVMSLRAFAAVATVFVACSFVPLQCLYRASAADLRAAGLELKQTALPNSLVVAADYGDPTALYYAERKGWHFTERDGIYNGHPNTSADAIVDLAQLRARGATHIVFYSGTLWWLDYYNELAQYLDQNATAITSSPQFKIYKLN